MDRFSARRLFAAPLVIGSLLLAALIVGAIWVGFRQPPSSWASLLHLSDCQLPCWVGIEPGRTTFEEAGARLQSAYGDASAYSLEVFAPTQFAVTDQHTHYRIGITLEASDELQTIPPTVQQIHLWSDVVPNQRVSIADLYSSLGDPEELRLIRMGSAPYLMMLYSAEQVGLATNALGCDAVFPAQKIYQIIISARPLDDYFGWVSSPAPWDGFRRCNDLRLAFDS